MKDILERDFDRYVERRALKVKLGIYVPIYKGWVRGADEGENDPTFKYAAETVPLWLRRLALIRYGLQIIS